MINFFALLQKAKDVPYVEPYSLERDGGQIKINASLNGHDFAIAKIGDRGEYTTDDMKLFADYLVAASPVTIEGILREYLLLRDTVLNVDRFFKAEDGDNGCDVGLCKTSAKFAVKNALKKTDARMTGEE